MNSDGVSDVLVDISVWKTPGVSDPGSPPGEEWPKEAKTLRLADGVWSVAVDRTLLPESSTRGMTGSADSLSAYRRERWSGALTFPTGEVFNWSGSSDEKDLRRHLEYEVRQHNEALVRNYRHSLTIAEYAGKPNSCGNCMNWRADAGSRHGVDNGWGRCDGPDEDSGFIVCGYDEPTLDTSPDFHCQDHERAAQPAVPRLGEGKK